MTAFFALQYAGMDPVVILHRNWSVWTDAFEFDALPPASWNIHRMEIKVFLGGRFSCSSLDTPLERPRIQ